MRRINIFEIDEDYLKFLHSFNKSIHYVTGTYYVTTTKYIGNLGEKNLCNFAPLSSDKNKLHINDINHIGFQPIIIDNKYLGVVRICNQIPIIDNNLLKPVIISSIYKKNYKYASLLNKQYKFINNFEISSILILKSAQCSFSNDFSLLKKAALYFDKSNYLVKKRIDSYPKVFSKGENKIFFHKMKQRVKNTISKSTIQTKN
jgi:hypothetical protein